MRYSASLSYPASLSPANIASGSPGLSISHPGFSPASPPPPQFITRLSPTVRLKGDRKQKEHFTVKHRLYEMATVWKRLAPGSEL